MLGFDGTSRSRVVACCPLGWPTSARLVVRRSRARGLPPQRTGALPAHPGNGFNNETRKNGPRPVTRPSVRRHMSADQRETARAQDHTATSHDADAATGKPNKVQVLVAAADRRELDDAEGEVKRERDGRTRDSSPRHRPRRSSRCHAPSVARLASTLRHTPRRRLRAHDATPRRAWPSWSLLAFDALRTEARAYVRSPTHHEHVITTGLTRTLNGNRIGPSSSWALSPHGLAA